MSVKSNDVNELLDSVSLDTTTTGQVSITVNETAPNTSESNGLDPVFLAVGFVTIAGCLAVAIRAKIAKQMYCTDTTPRDVQIEQMVEEVEVEEQNEIQ